MTETTHIYTLPKGADWRLVEGIGLVVAHPDRAPYIVNRNGTIEAINLCAERIEAYVSQRSLTDMKA